MKTRTWRESRLTLMLALLALAIGCASQPDSAGPAEGAGNPTPTNTPSPSFASLEPLNKIGPTPMQTSPSLAEIVKLAQAGVDESVILSYIDNSTNLYHPSAEEIVYLNDIGLSQRVISALLRHDHALQLEEAKLETAVSNSQAQAALPENPDAGQVAPPLPPAEATPAVAPATTGVAAPVVAESIPVPEETAPAAYAPPVQPVTVNYFYETLAPYGSWIDMPDYGWCWQPTVILHDPFWRPYCHRGRWLYTDCGWYWQSDYSWGWAPFHYGRWFRHARYGWAWRPDTCWGPSWVVWRRSPLYCGWAPLPPGAWFAGPGFTYYGAHVRPGFGFGLGIDSFAFVSYRRFGDRNLSAYCLSGHKAHTLFNQTTVVNNYFQGPNHRLINEGISRDHIAALTRSEIRKVTLRELSPAAGKFVKPDRLEKDGNELVVYRPQLQPASPADAVPMATRGQQELRKGRSGNPQPDPRPDALSRPQPVEAAVRTPSTLLTQPALNSRVPRAERSGERSGQTVTRSLVGGVPVTTLSAPTPAKRLEERQALSPNAGLAHETPTSSVPAQPSSRMPAAAEATFSSAPRPGPISVTPAPRPEVRKPAPPAAGSRPLLTRTPVEPRASGPTWTTPRSASILPAPNRVLTPPPSGPPPISSSLRQAPSSRSQSYVPDRSGSRQAVYPANRGTSLTKSVPSRPESYSSTPRVSRPPTVSSAPAPRATSTVPNFPPERARSYPSVNPAPAGVRPALVPSRRAETRSSPATTMSPVRSAPVYSPSTPRRSGPSPSVTIQPRTPPPSVSTAPASPARSTPAPARAPVSGADPRRNSKR